MKTISTLLLLLFIRICNAQVVVNGDFEVNVGGCHINEWNVDWNNYINDVYVFGEEPGAADILGPTCPDWGVAQSGSYFIGLSIVAADSGADAVALRVSGLLMADVDYRIRFFIKKDAAYLTDPIQVGLSMDSLSSGVLLETFPATFGTAWEEKEVFFTVDENQEAWITFTAVAANNGWMHIDNVRLDEATAVDNVDELAVSVWPNPTHDNLSISCGTNISNVVIYGVLGNVVLNQKLNASTAIIDISTFASGVYLVQTTTSDQRIGTSRITKK